ncbi:hypothetical protein EZS27_044100, partial [termite gut metagenome]
MNMKHIIYTLLLMFSLSVYAKDFTVTSPNGQLQLTLHVDKKAGTTYELRHGNTLLLNTSTIGMRL